MTAVSGQELSSNAGLPSDLLGNLEKVISTLSAFIYGCFACSASDQRLLLPVQVYY